MRWIALILLLAACDAAPSSESVSIARPGDVVTTGVDGMQGDVSPANDTTGPEIADDAGADDTGPELLDTRPGPVDGAGASDAGDLADTGESPDATGEDALGSDATDGISDGGPTDIGATGDADTEPDPGPLPPAGTVSDPIAIDRFPWVRDLDTRTAASDHLDRYDCAAADESGPELVHRLEVDAPGELVVEVAESGGVDVDLHLLDRAPPSTRSSAVPCVARANTRLSRQVTAGTWWLVVDTYVASGTPRSGPFKLAVELTVLDAWQVVDLAPGVRWRKKVYANYAGGRQTINVLEVAPALAGPFLRPYLQRGGGCIRPSRIGAEQGAIAAMNAGFFDTGPGTCPPLDLVKADGEVLSYNRLTGGAQRSIGWDADRTTHVAWVPKDRDWPEVVDGLGAHPSLVSAGAMRLEPDRDTDFYDGRHPRTALGVRADGTVLLVVVDGRTSAGVGMTLADLARHMVNLGAVDAVNLDGGGSTTLWLRDQSINGVVNHPSDNGVADHRGERGVSDVLLVFEP